MQKQKKLKKKTEEKNTRDNDKRRKIPTLRQLKTFEPHPPFFESDGPDVLIVHGGHHTSVGHHLQEVNTGLRLRHENINRVLL